MAQPLLMPVAARLDAESTEVAVVAAGERADARPARRPGRRSLIACLASAAVHAAAIVALGLIVATDRPPKTIARLEVDPTRPEPVAVERLPEMLPIDPQPAAAVTTAEFAPPPFTPVLGVPQSASGIASPVAGSAAVLDVYNVPQLLDSFDTVQARTSLGQVRSPTQRLLAVYYRGGNSDSERAVERALAWLAKHQQTDGGWSFDHRGGGDCNGRCRSPGALVQARTAATAMALLPFLAAGQTHKQGAYKKLIDDGLKFLVRNMQKTQYGGAFTQGGATMYGQALATIALCEALAMTRDRELIAPAQAAVSYVVNTQDPQGGGWRYFPGMPGDTSITGWQLMALKSADNAYITVPAATIERMRTFFDYMQQDDGAAYGYAVPDRASTSSTPVGLLCRMVLGWKRDEPALVRGIDALAADGPKPDNVYFNFYATQVLHHFGGPRWEKWNSKMRDGLIVSQTKEGHEAGSWMAVETNVEDRHASTLGGRLYTTALAALTLEVYYRYLPLYGKRITFGE